MRFGKTILNMFFATTAKGKSALRYHGFMHTIYFYLHKEVISHVTVVTLHPCILKFVTFICSMLSRLKKNVAMNKTTKFCVVSIIDSTKHVLWCSNDTAVLLTKSEIIKAVKKTGFLSHSKNKFI